MRLKGNSYDPYYSLLGVKWFYGNKRLQNLYRYENKPYKPRLTFTKEELKWSSRYVRKGKFALLWDLHSVPAWMMDSPVPIKNPHKLSPAHQCQRYAPRDYKAYGKIIEDVASEIAAKRKYLFPYMKRNYYQIHWEPDWHWAGSEEQFIKLYKTAHEAICKVDPSAVLTGANYGVLSKGNRLMESLFKKGLGKYLDGITFHAYFLNQKIPPEEMGLIPEMRKLIALRNKYLKPDAPIFQTEWGFSWKGNYLNHDVPREELLRELAWTVRGHAIILGEGADSTWFFYAADLGRSGGGFAYNLDNIVRVGPVTISPKPKTMATCTFTRVLEGTKSLGPLTALGDGVYGYLFRRGNQLVAMIWSKTETTRIVINTGLPKTNLIDCMGNQKIIKTDKGKIELTVSPVPQYIMGLSEKIIPAENIISAVQGDILKVGAIPKGTEVTLNSGMNMIYIQSSETALPSHIKPGEWLLSYSDARTGYVIKSVRVNIMKRFELLGLSRISSDSYELKLCNNLPTKNEVNIRLFSGSKVGCSRKLTLPPESTKTLTLTTAKGFQSGGKITVMALGPNNISDNKTLILSNFIPAADRSADPPVVDGSLKEWLLESFIKMSDKESLAFKKAPWDGVGDLSVLYSLAYDKDNFYFAFKVFDQSHCPPIRKNEAWRGDSIQLAFGLGLDSAGNAAKTKKFSLELDRSDRVVVKELSKAPPVPPQVLRILTGKQLAARILIDKTDGATIYEGAIPWKLITGGGKPEKIGFGAMINDADSKEQIVKDARKTMLVGKGPGLFNIMLKFQTIQTK